MLEYHFDSSDICLSNGPHLSLLLGDKESDSLGRKVYIFILSCHLKLSRGQMLSGTSEKEQCVVAGAVTAMVTS